MQQLIIFQLHHQSLLKQYISIIYLLLYQTTMNKSYPSLYVVILFLYCVIGLSNCSCDQTHFTRIPQTVIIDSNDFNITFTSLQSNMPAITDKKSTVTTTTYTLSNIKPVLRYLKETQEIQIGNNSIQVRGGAVRIQFDFQWSKKTLINTKRGTGKGIIISNKLELSKALVIDGEFIHFFKKSANDLELLGKIDMTQINPNVTDSDKEIYIKLLNQASNSTSVLADISTFLNNSYQKTIDQTLKQEKQTVSTNYPYIWQTPTSQIIINFTMNIKTLLFDSQTQQFTQLAQINDDEGWQCNISAPTSPYDPKQYGDNQQIISLDVFKNLLRVATQKGAFDTKLQKISWQSNNFQFYAGDLYDAFKNIQNDFEAREEIRGICKANSENLDLKPQDKVIIAKINYDCELQITEKRIVSFKTDIRYNVNVIPKPKFINLVVQDFELESIEVNQQPAYPIMNQQLFEHYLNSCLKNIKGMEVFGSNWSTRTRNQPVLSFVDEKYLFIYDGYKPLEVEQ